MSWNYRVIKHKTNTGNPDLDKLDPEWFGLHEVYYDKDGKIEGWTEEPVNLCATDLKELREDVKMMFDAVHGANNIGKLAVLNEEDLPKRTLELKGDPPPPPPWDTMTR